MPQIATTIATILLGSILFVPTFISESLLFPFITGKNLLFRAITLTVFAIVIGVVWYKKELVYKYTLPIALFLTWVASLLISALVAESPTRALWSNFERMEGWFTIALLFVLFYSLLQVIAKKETWLRIWKVSLLPNIYIGFFGLSQFFGAISISQSQGSLRPDGTLGNSSYLGGYALMYVFVCAWLFTQSRNVFERILYVLIGLLNVVVLTLTLTRGAMLGLAIGSFVVLTLFTGQYVYQRYIAQVRVHKYLFIAPVLFFVGLALTGLFLANTDSRFVKENRVLNRIASISLSDKSLEGRLINWGMAWEGVQERPLFGWGQDNYLYVFSTYFDPRMSAYEPWYDRSHNVFFDWLIAGGVLGLLGYLSLYVAMLWMLWFRKNSRAQFSFAEATILTGFLVAYFFHNATVFDNIASYILFVFLFAYITWQSYADTQHTLKISGAKLISLTLVLSVLTLVALYQLVYKPWSSARTLIDAMQSVRVALVAPNDATAQAWAKQNIGSPYSREELLSYSRQQFIEATEHPLGRTEAREQLAQQLVPIASNETVSDAEKNAWVEVVFTELEKEIATDPSNARSYQLLGNLWLQFNQPARALEYLDRAQAVSPNKQLIMFDRAVAHQLLGDYQKTLEINKYALDLNPRFLTAQARYIFSLYRTGQDAEAERLEPQFIQDALAQSYDLVTNKAYYDQVVAAKVDYRVSRALTAYQNNDMQAYRTYFEQVKVLNPSVAERLTALIESRE